ncbi:MAG: HK97 gp10 family phage protein [Nitrospinae bacterium]|nr:HK97 gp10 family phage protein [Nitrospinota bacterium]
MFRRYVTLEELPEMPAIAWEGVLLLAHESMAEITGMLRREVMTRTPIGASGNLRGSIYTEIKGENPRVLRGVVASRTPYARYVEFGRRAGGRMPPWREGTSLYRWVAHKLGPPDGSIERVSFLVARSIARHGIPGRRMFARAFEENQSRIDRRIRELVDEIARRVSG